MPTNLSAKGVDRTLSPKKAIAILTKLLTEAEEIEREPFASPRRDQWTTTAQGALERAFENNSSILRSFGAAQGLSFTRGSSQEILRKQINQTLATEVSVLRSAIAQLSWGLEDDEKLAASAEPGAQDAGVLVLISHSGKDANFAEAVTSLLRSGVGLLADQIRCSSVNGYRLPVGVHTEDQLRDEVNAANVVVGLITPNSQSSHFVMFELGARWGRKLFIAPLLAGVAPDELQAPLNLLNALSADSESQLIQFVENIAKRLNKAPQSVAAYLSEIATVQNLAKLTPKTGALQSPPTDEPRAAALKQENSSLAIENAQRRERLRFKRTLKRINGHTYIDGDDAEMCSRCAAVEYLAVPLQDMNLDGSGRKATCPHCRMPRGNGPPIPRKRSEGIAQRIAEDSQ